MSQVSSMNVQAFVKKWREIKVNFFASASADYLDLLNDLHALENHNRRNIELATKTLQDALTVSAEMTRLQSENERLRVSIGKANSSIQHLLEAQETRKTQLQAYWNEICQLRDKLAAKETEVENISKDNAHHIKRGDDYWQQVIDLENKVATLSNENNRLKMGDLRLMNDTQADTIRCLQRRIEAMAAVWNEYEREASRIGMLTADAMRAAQRKA